MRLRLSLLVSRWPLTLFLSGVLAAIVWGRPPLPDWVSETVEGKTCPIGFTPDGLMVSLDSPDNVKAKSALRVREAATGRIVRTIKLGYPVSNTAELTPDGEWAILRRPFSSPIHQILVTSIRTGEPRCPPILDESPPRGKYSPDGRYKAVYPTYISNTSSPGFIADLTTGIPLYPTEALAEFSPDNTQWISVDDSKVPHEFVFHRLHDGKEIGRSPLPVIPGMSRMILERWSPGRLEFIAIVANGKAKNARRYSLRVEGVTLFDLHPDPLFSDYSPVEQGGGWEKGDDWAIRVSADSWAARGVSGGQSWLVLKLLRNPRTSHWLSFRYRWQPISIKTGEPIGRGIVLVEGDYVFNIPMFLSHDGKWLAEAGDRLRVWRVPQPTTWGRVAWTLLAAAVPWLAWLRRPRRGTSTTLPPLQTEA